MRRCFELALRGAGSVSPNPMVGAVLVYDDCIIGEGWHQAYGQAHAEVHCFANVSTENQALISKSTLYCSLEPCSHFGKTPPCVDLVLAHRVPRVVIANTDPNPLVAGKGIAKMRAAGVEVIEGVLEAEGLWLNRIFFIWITQKRPYIILKWAESADGFLGKKGERTAISGALAQRLVHRWRAEADAILVGATTARVDNPRLDVRRYFGKNSLRVLLDGSGSVPLDCHLLCDQEPTMVFGAARPGLRANKTFIPGSGSVPLLKVLEKLQQENRACLLVEGGANLLQQFLDAGLWDEIRVIKSAGVLGEGVAAPGIPTGIALREQFVLGSDKVSFYSMGHILDTSPDPLTLVSRVGLPK
jgi:diaminohydroxyphosphoribosylaminopyrimidine deaminase / 5-amino-6-(5-phosphoribosylamino)uracil reductase